MPKLKTTRFDETVDYVQHRAQSTVPQQVRNDIATFITGQYHHSLIHHTSYDDVAGGMSVRVNLTPGVGRGSTDEREQRRAIYLLWSAIGGVGLAPEVQAHRDESMSAAPNALPALLDKAMLVAAAKASAAGIAWVYTQNLVTHPQRFLRTYLININGAIAGRDKYKANGNAPWTNQVTYHFFYDAGTDTFQFQPTALPGVAAQHQVVAASVPALHWSDVNGRGNVMQPTQQAPSGFDQMFATDLTGSSLMLTTQLTGCVFCYMGTGATVWASHVLPMNMTPATLADQLLGNAQHVQGGDFANFPNAPHPPLRVFGMTRGNATVTNGNQFYPQRSVVTAPGTCKYVSVLGLNTTGQSWRIYTQTVSSAGTIMEVRRLL